MQSQTSELAPPTADTQAQIDAGAIDMETLAIWHLSKLQTEQFNALNYAKENLKAAEHMMHEAEVAGEDAEQLQWMRITAAKQAQEQALAKAKLEAEKAAELQRLEAEKLAKAAAEKLITTPQPKPFVITTPPPTTTTEAPTKPPTTPSPQAQMQNQSTTTPKPTTTTPAPPVTTTTPKPTSTLPPPTPAATLAPVTAPPLEGLLYRTYEYYNVSANYDKPHIEELQEGTQGYFCVLGGRATIPRNLRTNLPRICLAVVSVSL